jgi:hypothetical protein
MPGARHPQIKNQKSKIARRINVDFQSVFVTLPPA